ncbi:MAG: VanZ family protein [Gammaproteobacteria bacterium]|nr:VanZ family protein [Gammaproteobacteria bacterium]
MKLFLHLLRYPLHGTLIVGAITFTLLIYLAVKASVLGLALLIFIAPGFIKYQYKITQRVAAGRKRPPVASVNDLTPFTGLHFVIHLVLFVGAVVWLNDQQTEWSQPLVIFLAVIFPASVAIMAMTDDIFQAFNPIRIVKVIARVAKSYVVVLLFILALRLLQLQILAHSDLEILSLFIALYASLVIFAGVGKLLRWHEHELGLEVISSVAYTNNTDRQSTEKQRTQATDEIFQLFQVDEGWKAFVEIEKQLSLDNHSLPSYELIMQSMHDWEKQGNLAAGWASQFAIRYVQRLLSAVDDNQEQSDSNNQHRALELVERRLRRDRNFKLPTALASQLAEYAKSIGHSDTAVQLVYDAEVTT